MADFPDILTGDESGDDVPLRAPDTFLLERPSYAVRNLLEGDLGGTIRSLLSPESLSPSQARTLADEWGVTDGPFGAVMKTLSNPLVLLAAVTSTVYPVGEVTGLLKFSKRLAGYERKLGWLESKLGWFGTIFEGTETGAAGKDIATALHVFKNYNGTRLNQGIADAARRGLNIAGDIAQQRALAFRADELLDPATHMQRLAGYGLDFNPILNPDTPALRDFLSRSQPAFEAHEAYRISTGKQAREFLKSKEVQKFWNKHLEELGHSPGEISRLIESATGHYPHVMADPSMRIRQVVAPGSEKLSTSTNAMMQSYFEAQGLPYEFGPHAASRRPGIPGALKPREDVLIPEPDHIQDIERLFPGVLDPRYVPFLRSLKKAGVPTYSLDYGATMGENIHRMGAAFAWDKIAEGATLSNGTRVLNDLLYYKREGDPLRAKLLDEVYIPMLQGRPTPRQAISAQLWGNRLRQYSEWMRPDSTLGKAVRTIGGEKLGDDLHRWMFNAEGPLAHSVLFSGASRFLYNNALGGNLWAAALNPMLGFMTGAPILGVENMTTGLNRLTSKAQSYFKLRDAGLTSEKALQKTFPAFSRSGGALAPTIDETFNKSLISAWNLADRGTVSGLEKVERAMMSMFQSTEQFTRMWMFESAYVPSFREYKATGLNKFVANRKAIENASKIMDYTSFIGGPFGTPAAFADSNSLVKQFMTFGLRSADWVFNTSTLMGSGATGGRNWGNLARMVGAGVLAHHVGQEMGLDMDAGLFPGTIPVGPGGRPFAPFPVSPAVGLAGAALSDISKGQFEQTRQYLPLLFPGGVALSRAIPTIGTYLAPEASQGVAELLRKDYVDYDHPGPDGRYAVMSSDGNLIRYASPMQIFMKASGLGSGGQDAVQERELVKYLTNQRDQIRAHRKSVIEAMIANDVNEADRLQLQFQKQYGMPLTIKPQDLQAVRLRQIVPRLERVLNMLPAELRGQYAEVIQTSLMAEVSGMLGIDPDLLRSGTPASRMPQRFNFNVSGFGGIGNVGYQGGGATTLGPIGAMPDYSRRPTVQGFEAFSAF